MRSTLLYIFLAALVGAAAACSWANAGSTNEIAFPLPTPKPEGSKLETAVLAGGCFWGLEGVYEHVKGVKDVESGYAGGAREGADYDSVSSGTTGHAESVKITFDPSKITYQQILFIFFAVAHDPTELDRQGPDTGKQYRSAIFYENDAQKKVAKDLIAALTASKAFSAPIVTEVSSLKGFYPAESYHQNYMKLHPDDPYIVYNDAPKVVALKAKFADLYHD